MWGREEKLVRLYEELDTLYIFDRIHDYGADVRNRGDDNAYASRQERRSEILAEIAKLRVRKPWFEGFGAQMLKHCRFSLQPQVTVPFDGDIDPASVNSGNAFFVELGNADVDAPAHRSENGASRVIGVNQIVWDPATRVPHDSHTPSSPAMRPTPTR